MKNFFTTYYYDNQIKDEMSGIYRYLMHS